MSVLKWLGLSRSKRPRRQQHRHASLRLEPLEKRDTPTPLAIVNLAPLVHDRSPLIRHEAREIVHDARLLAADGQHLSALEQRMRVVPALEHRRAMTRQAVMERGHIARAMADLHREVIHLLERIPDPPPHGLVGVQLPPDVPPIDPSIFPRLGGGPVFDPGDLESGHPGTNGPQVLIVTWGG